MNPEGRLQTHSKLMSPGPCQSRAWAPASPQRGGDTVCGAPLTPPSLVHMGRVLEHLSSLSREVNLDYERSMNKINFDQIVASKPDTFSYVTLPKKEEEKVPKQGEVVRQRQAHGHPSGPPMLTCTYPVPCVHPPSFPNLESWGREGGG